jgi:hypothetical protein
MINSESAESPDATELVHESEEVLITEMAM